MTGPEGMRPDRRPLDPLVRWPLHTAAVMTAVFAAAVFLRAWMTDSPVCPVRAPAVLTGVFLLFALRGRQLRRRLQGTEEGDRDEV